MRRLFKAMATLAALLVAALPLALAALYGLREWPLEAIAGLALFYVLWLPATAAALIWALDRLGFHFGAEKPGRREPPSRRERRRGRASLRYLEAVERSRREARQETARRRRREAEAGAARERTAGSRSERSAEAGGGRTAGGDRGPSGDGRGD